MTTRTALSAVAVIVIATLLVVASTSRTTYAQIVPPPGEPNPNAPRELSQFAYLIGKWQAQARIQLDDSTWEESAAVWTFRYILDGYAIAGVFQSLGEDGELTTSGMGFHYFNRDQDRWIIEYFVPRISMLMLQAQQDAGGVQVSDTSVTVVTRMPAGHLLRETHLILSEDHLTYRTERSDDGGESWTERGVTELLRIED